MRYVQNTHCERCGSGYCHIYSTKIPIKSLTIITMLIFVFLMALVALLGTGVAITHINSQDAVIYVFGAALAVAVYFFLSFAVMAFLSRKRIASIAICQNCNAYHVVTPPPSSVSDWDYKEVEKLLSIRNLRQPGSLYRFDADTMETPMTLNSPY